MMHKNYLYAKIHFNSFQRRLEFLFWSLIHYKSSKSLFEYFSQSPLHLEIISNHPMILRKIFRRYIYCDMPTPRKAKNLLAHYTFMFNTFNNELIRQIYTNSPVNLLNVVFDNEILRVDLGYLVQQEREGELAIQLIDSNNQRLYSIAFSFLPTKDRLSLIIGGIQGHKSDDQSSIEVIKTLTKNMHGLRPRNFLIFILRTISKTLGVERLEAVTTKKNITQCRRAMSKKFDKINADYDLYWEEEGGIRYENIFVLPIHEQRKSFDEIKSNKRSMYTKRYAMMDNMATSIKEKIEISMEPMGYPSVTIVP